MDAQAPADGQPSASVEISDSDRAKITDIATRSNVGNIEAIITELKGYVRDNADALKDATLEEKFEKFTEHVMENGQDRGMDKGVIQGAAVLGHLIKMSFAASNAAAPAAGEGVGAGAEQAAAQKAIDAPKVDATKADVEKPEARKNAPSEEEMERIRRAMQQPPQQQQQPSMAGAFKYLRDALDFKGKKAAQEKLTQAQQSAARVDMQSWLDSRGTSDQKLEEVISLTRAYAAASPTATPEQKDEMKTKLDTSIGDLQRAVDFESRKVVDEVQSKRMGVGEAGDHMKDRVKKISEKMEGLLNSDEVTNNPDLKGRLEQANEKMNKELQKVIENLMEMLKRIFSPKSKNAAAPT